MSPLDEQLHSLKVEVLKNVCRCNGILLSDESAATALREAPSIMGAFARISGDRSAAARALAPLVRFTARAARKHLRNAIRGTAQ
jgi:hypothetical protein